MVHPWTPAAVASVMTGVASVITGATSVMTGVTCMNGLRAMVTRAPTRPACGAAVPRHAAADAAVPRHAAGTRRLRSRSVWSPMRRPGGMWSLMRCRRRMRLTARNRVWASPAGMWFAAGSGGGGARQDAVRDAAPAVRAVCFRNSQTF